MLKLNHKNLDVWKLSLDLVVEIYSLTENFPPEEKFGLTNQLRRASVSVASNISEGSARTSAKERKRFYEIARSSLVEIDIQLVIADRLKFLPPNSIKNVAPMVNSTFAMLTSLKSSTQNC